MTWNKLFKIFVFFLSVIILVDLLEKDFINLAIDSFILVFALIEKNKLRLNKNQHLKVIKNIIIITTLILIIISYY